MWPVTAKILTESSFNPKHHQKEGTPLNSIKVELKLIMFLI